jgi:protein TonB
MPLWHLRVLVEQAAHQYKQTLVNCVVVFQPDADAYYPSFSKRSGEQGTVVVRLIISESGEVEDIALLQSSSFPRLDRAATDIGRRYRFKPFLVNGSPQRISTNLLIKFNLKN